MLRVVELRVERSAGSAVVVGRVGSGRVGPGMALGRVTSSRHAVTHVMSMSINRETMLFRL